MCIRDRNLSLEAQLEQVAGRLAADYWMDYGRQISGIVADSFLEEYDEFNIGIAFRKAVQASIVYTLSVRCAEDTESQFEPEDFRDVSDFNTRQTAAALGTAVSSLSGCLLYTSYAAHQFHHYQYGVSGQFLSASKGGNQSIYSCLLYTSRCV